MKKFILVILIFIIAFYGLVKVRDYYNNKMDDDIEVNNIKIEEKKIDKVSVNNIIRSINDNLAISAMQNPSYKVPEVVTDLSLVTVRGEKPESINLEIRNMQVYKGDIAYKGIIYHYENGNITVKE